MHIQISQLVSIFLLASCTSITLAHPMQRDNADQQVVLSGPDPVCVAPQPPPPPPTKDGDVLQYRYIVTLKDGVDAKAHLAKVHAIISATSDCPSDKPVKSLTEIVDDSLLLDLGIYLALLGPSAEATLAKDPDVETITLDTLALADSVVTDHDSALARSNLTCEGPTFHVEALSITHNNGWHLHRLNTGLNPVVEAPPRTRTSLDWDYTTIIPRSVNVYVIDTGVNDHNDFGPRLIRARGVNVLLNPENPADAIGTQDTNGHGTRIAGMVAGTRTGSNQFANIIPIKAGDSNGHLSHLAIINGISRSITDANNPGNVPRGPSIINVSAAMSISSAMKRVLQRAIAANMVVINSAGNGYSNFCSQRVGRADGVLVVGASTINDVYARSSNFGPCVDVFAPGQDMTALDWNSRDGYLTMQSGTSEAAGITSGIAATLLGNFPGDTPSKIQQRVLDLAVDALAEEPGSPKPKTTTKLVQAPVA